jgi:O-antigen ligase
MPKCVGLRASNPLYCAGPNLCSSTAPTLTPILTTALPLSWPLLAGALLAFCTPAWLGYSVSPSATFLNQAAAVTGWGIWLLLVLVGRSHTLARTPLDKQAHPSLGWVLLAALLTIALWVVLAWGALSLPLSLALSAWLMVMGAATVAGAGMWVGGCPWQVSLQDTTAGYPVTVFRALAWALVVAGLGASFIGMLQVFAPSLADGQWLAASGFDGRATGNFRQPNHLGSLLLWAMVALVAVVELSARESAPRHRWPGVAQGLALAFLMVGVVLSASRTAALALLILVAWGALDKKLGRFTRWLLLSTPLLYAVIWWGLAAWGQATGQTFGGEGRFSASGDISSSRFAIWRDTIALIAQHPWTGVGWGRFNFAWSLTPFPDRPTAFFDHSHNLLLHLAVELGLPMALLLTGLLFWAFVLAGLRAWRAPGTQGLVLRSCWVMLFLVGLHSQLEYPLWYAYFLFPTAFVWGLCLGAGPQKTEALPSTQVRTPPRATLFGLRVAAVLMVMVGAASVLDYWRVVVIYAPTPGSGTLRQRIDAGQHSLLFAHHAHFAEATTAIDPGRAVASIRISAHHLLDTRLMVAWAQALHAQGDVERARHIAARLREFRNKNSDAFFAPCQTVPLIEPAPFQCTAPSRLMDWRDFR